MAYGEELKCLASRQKLEDSFFSDTEAGRSHCPFFEPSPTTEPHSWQIGAISETPSTWLTPFVLPWRSTETVPPNFKYAETLL